MAYGDYDGPNKPNKGHEGGACNRTRCQAEPALWYNHGSYSWYCSDCADDIGNDPVNMRDWMASWHPRLGHMMFETREQMDQREGAKKPDPLSFEGIFGQTINEAFYGKREKPKSNSLARLLKKAKY